MSDQTTTPDPPGPTCSKCGQNPAGPGGILCAECFRRAQGIRLPGPSK